MSFRPIESFEALLDDPLVSGLTPWAKFIKPNASVGNVAATWDGLTYAFKVALEAIFEEHFKRSHSDLLEYPLAYLARHYAELSLKSLWHRCRAESLLEMPIPKTHHLGSLWVPIRAALKDAEISQFDDSFSRSFEMTLNHFDELDRKSDGFRYPPSDAKSTREIDSSLLAQELDRMTVFFYGLNAIMDERQDFLRWQSEI